MKGKKLRKKYLLALITVTILLVNSFSGFVFAADNESATKGDLKRNIRNIAQCVKENRTNHSDSIASISDLKEVDIQETEPNDTLSTADVINFSSKGDEEYGILGTINSDEDLDCYKLTVTDKGYICMVGLWNEEYVAQGKEEDLSYAIYDPSTDKYCFSELVYLNDDVIAGGAYAQVIVVELNPGTYYLMATAESGYTGENYGIITDFEPSVTGISLNKANTTLSAIGATEKLTATVVPGYATEKTVSWSSSNTNVATVDSNGLVTAVANGTAIITATSTDGDFTATCAITVQTPAISVKYRTHVQDYGWQNYVSDGIMSGTSGKSKRLEGINISVSGDTNLGIKYTTHVQDIGWQAYATDGAMSGTSGQSKRLEAIKIALTGTDAANYDIYYRVHAEDYGWLDWAKNGQAAGTEGLSKRLEAIQIQIVPKGSNPGLTTTRPFISVYGNGNITYMTHVQEIGWQGYVSDGALSGTTGQSKRLEAINIHLSTNMPSGSVVYQTHVQDYGWMAQVSNGAMSGTSGQSKRLEAIKISLTGEIANEYDIYYRVHAQNVGWMGWAKNGQSAGTAGYSYRLEGIQIQLVPKDGAAPGSTDNAFKNR